MDPKPGTTRRPLEGIRVVDMGQIFSVPYAGALMADMGAEVIKVEGPARMDSTRGTVSGVYPENIPGNDPWNRRSNFNILNRGKKSLVLDLNQAEGLQVLKDLIQTSDVFMENFTPRVMKRWGLEYPDLKALKPGIIMVSNTGYGRGNGPYANYPAQATSQEATHGLAHVTGYEGDLPSKAGAAYVDFLACWACLMGVALALRQRRRTGVGQHVDVGMYQMGCFTVTEYVMDWLANGRLGGRIGNRHRWQAPQGCYRCAGDDQWCVLTVQDDAQWQTLCAAMKRADLAADARFATAQGRMAGHDEIDAAICAWTAPRSKHEVMQALQAQGIAAGPVLDARDLHFDAHLRERCFMEKVTFPPERHLGQRIIVGRPWRFGPEPLRHQGPAPAFGQHNREVLQGILGYDESRCAELERSGVIAQRPLKVPQGDDETDMSKRVRQGQFASYDSDYRERLGLIGDA